MYKRQVLDGSQPPFPKRRRSPGAGLPIFGPCLLWLQSPISATAELLRQLVIRICHVISVYGNQQLCSVCNKLTETVAIISVRYQCIIRTSRDRNAVREPVNLTAAGATCHWRQRPPSKLPTTWGLFEVYVSAPATQHAAEVIATGCKSVNVVRSGWVGVGSSMIETSVDQIHYTGL